MTDISLNIDSLYDIDTPEHVLANNRWIKDAITKSGVICNKYSYEFSFDIGALHFNCDDQEEFKQHTFGQNPDIKRANMFAFLNDGDMIGFISSPRWVDNNNLYISSKNKTALVAIVDALNLERAKYESAPAVTNNVNIKVEGSQVGAITVGNNNVIETKVEKETETHSPPKSEKVSFWTGVWQTITSNIVWVILVSVILFLLMYLGITQPDWLVLQ